MFLKRPSHSFFSAKVTFGTDSLFSSRLGSGTVEVESTQLDLSIKCQVDSKSRRLDSVCKEK